MTNSTPAENPAKRSAEVTQTAISPWRCASSSVVAGAIATACYFMTSSIAQTFARSSIHSNNLTALKIASLVRTFVIGISSLATFTFALASLGLMALAVQILFRQLAKRLSPPSDMQ